MTSEKTNLYFDYAASTPIDPRVWQMMEKYRYDGYANPSSLHGFGRRSKQILDESRSQIAGLMKVGASEIYFTSGGTESDNWAIKGVCELSQNKKKTIIVSAIEHKAIIESARQMSKHGFELIVCPVNEQGILDLDYLTSKLSDDVLMISIIWANNETGVIQDMKKIVDIVRSKSPKTIIHSDACQAWNYLDVYPKEIGLDMMSFNASKIYGPRGIGGLWVSGKIRLEPMIVGGGQEGGMRSGTENIVGVVGMTEAMKISHRLREVENKRISMLRDRLESRIRKQIVDVVVNSDRKICLPNILNISLAGAEGETMLLYLDQEGMAVSTGSACSASDLKPSHVLMALGLKEELAHCSLRISLGRWTDDKGIDLLSEAIIRIAKKVRSMSAIY